MKKQLQGISLILFGLLLGNAHNYLHRSISHPIALAGLIIGVAGLVLSFWPEKK